MNNNQPMADSPFTGTQEEWDKLTLQNQKEKTTELICEITYDDKALGTGKTKELMGLVQDFADLHSDYFKKIVIRKVKIKKK